MKETPPKKEKLKEVIVSDEIKKYLSEATWLIEGEDVRLPDYIKLKTELRDILTPVGIWSDEFNKWIDKSLGGISLLGKQIEAVGKWMEQKGNKYRKENLERYRAGAKASLEYFKGWSPTFEKWLLDGSPKDLQKVGENMDYMGRVSSTIGAIRSVKEIFKEDKGKK
ncbi:MAG: hypothetical protein US18_C0006G0016 [Parcubacteria group bacterium GW2011_GWB1_36_5]|nr:MAG: hypothetical protein US18_C0006G0016 [Parcubacteria group bacterium GW2011_GWB1_36_5]